MDYKKKYENALEWARQVINGECGFIRKDVEEVFPELKESEDERIRKGMLQGFKDYGEPEYVWWAGVKVKECIAWLEKQDEQKELSQSKVTMNSCQEWSEEDEDMLKKAIKLLDEFGGDRNACAYTLQEMSCRDCADWLKSLKERLNK